MTTSYTLTGDFNDLLGEEPRVTGAWLETNLPAGTALVDLDANKVLLAGPKRITLDASNTFSISLIATNSTGTNVTDGTLRYRVRAQYSDGTGVPRTWESGFFDLTAAADLSDKVGGAGDLDVTIAPSASLIDAPTAANVTGPSQTRTALDAAYAPLADFTTASALLDAVAATPATLPAAHAKGYDSRLSLYNLRPKHLRRTRAALAAVRLGVDDARIAVIGDSTTYGANAAPGTSDYPTVMRKILANEGMPAKGEIAIGNNAAITTGTTDPRMSTTGTWTGLSGIFGVLGAAGSLLFSSTVTGTAVRFLTADATQFKVTIDGGAPQTITPTGSASYYTAEITGLANTTHQVLIEWIAGTLILHAVEIYGTAAGVRMLNAGCSGQSSDWHANNGDTTWGTIPTLSAFSPHLVLINIGINDATGTVGDVEPFGANVQKLITQLGDAADVVLVAHTNVSDRDYSAQFERLYDLADSNDLPLVDLADALGTYAQMLAVGAMNADPLHPTASGYGWMGRAILNALAL